MLQDLCEYWAQIKGGNPKLLFTWRRLSGAVVMAEGVKV